MRLHALVPGEIAERDRRCRGGARSAAVVLGDLWRCWPL